MRLGRLFIGAQRTNDSRPKHVIASWSYVTGYWRWALYRSANRAWFWKLGGTYGDPAQGRQRFSPMGGIRHPFGMQAAIPLLGCFHLSTQPPLPAMKAWRRPDESGDAHGQR